MDVKVTVTFVVNDMLDKEECDGDWKVLALEIIQDEGICGVMDFNTVVVVDVEEIKKESNIP